jgi:transposase
MITFGPVVMDANTESAVVYFWSGYRNFGGMTQVLIDEGFHVANVITWIKESACPGYGDYKFASEFMLYGWLKGGGRHRWFGPPNEQNIWKIDRILADSRLHPTAKPVELARRVLRNSTQKGDVVFDGCAGACFNLIACQQMGRIFRGIEIEPSYVDTAVLRYIRMFGPDSVSKAVMDKYFGRKKYYIQGIQNGTINPNRLSQEILLGVVEVLSAEGSSTSQIAQVLGKNERTIRRYLEAVREKNAISPNLKLAKEIMGELLQKARASHAYLLRLARSQGGSIAEKSQSEYYAWRIWSELINHFQSVGYLPMKPTEITGDLMIHLDSQESGPSLEELKKQLQDIKALGDENGGLNQEVIKKINLLLKKIERAEIE